MFLYLYLIKLSFECVIIISLTFQFCWSVVESSRRSRRLLFDLLLYLYSSSPFPHGQAGGSRSVVARSSIQLLWTVNVTFWLFCDVVFVDIICPTRCAGGCALCYSDCLCCQFSFQNIIVFSCLLTFECRFVQVCSFDLYVRMIAIQILYSGKWNIVDDRVVGIVDERISWLPFQRLYLENHVINSFIIHQISLFL